jgi:acylpyruvate hydrolase
MKIICIGHNYKKHIEELNSPYPEKPVFFLKPDSSILRNKDFFLPDFSENVHHEVELIVRINRLGKHIQSKFAYRYFDAVGIGLDLTARDLQEKCKEKGLPWEIAKSFDGSAVVSEFIPIEEIPDISNVNFSLKKNNKIVQVANSSDMLFNIGNIIEYVSNFMTLKIGDIIFTGTPSGVGKLEIGDNLQAYLEDKEMLNIMIK